MQDGHVQADMSLRPHAAISTVADLLDIQLFELIPLCSCVNYARLTITPDFGELHSNAFTPRAPERLRDVKPGTRDRGDSCADTSGRRCDKKAQLA